MLNQPYEYPTARIPSSKNRALLNSLRAGGYILYVRHAEATVGEDQPYLYFQYCSTQRNLSENGKRQARTFGEALRRLRIPVQYPIHTSPFCRTRETATLAFGGQNIQIYPFLVEIYQLSYITNPFEQSRILTSLQSTLENSPSQGKNKVIIAHSFPEGIGLGQLPNMGTVIIKPFGMGNGYEVVDVVSLTDLTNWLETG